MKTHIIEATNGFNWGKFLIATFTPDEWAYRSKVPGCENLKPVLIENGWNPTARAAWVLDLQTGEGAYFNLHGYAQADLERHKIWVCPLFEPFLLWLYKQKSLDNLPSFIEVEGHGSIYGYRRQGSSAPDQEHLISIQRAVAAFFAGYKSPSKKKLIETICEGTGLHKMVVSYEINEMLERGELVEHKIKDTQVIDWAAAKRKDSKNGNAEGARAEASE